MKTFEKILNAWVLGAIFPIFFFLAGWWTTIDFVPEQKVFVFGLGGFSFGILLDVVFLKGWLKRVYTLNIKALVAAYLFYSVCFFGFFMGVPVFNLLPGVIAGYYWGRRLKRANAAAADDQHSQRQIGMFTAIVMLLVSLSSAYLALNDPYTAANLEGMFKLGFEITKEMLIWLIILGGASLVSLQYVLTKKAAQFAITAR